MARLYADNHVSFAALALLAGLGHQVTRCQNVGMRDAKDHQHLLYAAEQRAIRLTHDRGFEDWHAAWCDWSLAWNVSVQHAGILLFPNEATWPALRAAEELDRVLRGNSELANVCYVATLEGAWLRI